MNKIIKAIFPVILLFSLSVHAMDLGLRRRIHERYYLAPQDEGEQTRLNKRQIVKDTACCAGTCAICGASMMAAKGGLMLLVSPMMCSLAAGPEGVGVFESCMNFAYQEACAEKTQICALGLAALGCFKMAQNL